MSSRSHHVVFHVRLAEPLLAAARRLLGAWVAPRGVTLEVTAEAQLVVTSADHHETYARKQVLECAGDFLREIEMPARADQCRAWLSAPSCRDRPEIYVVAIGAAVSIARTDPHCRPAVVLKRKRRESVQLELLNHRAD